MSFDLSGSRLLLNPRLPNEARASLEDTWRSLVLPRFQGETVVGITTSGSSGDPRGRLIVLSKKALLANAASVNDWFKAKETDVWMKTLPTFHVGGLGILLRASLTGASVAVTRLERWEPRAFYEELESSGATLLSLVSTQLYDLAALKLHAPKKLRAVILGGGRLDAGLRERAHALGWPVFASYGMTECCSQVATAKVAGDPRLFPISHASLRTTSGDQRGDLHGNLHLDQRIEVNSAALLSAQVVFSTAGTRLELHQAGDWFRTEDHGRVEADGSLTILGRSADFVKIGGEGVVLARLEEKLESIKTELGYEGDAVVLAAADERLGALIVLLIGGGGEVRGGGAALTAREQRMVERFNESVLPFERIRASYRLEKLPRSELGKLLRSAALETAGLKPVASTTLGL
jgi:O-succinylbenzoic acid--CoA ligase